MILRYKSLFLVLFSFLFWGGLSAQQEELQIINLRALFSPTYNNPSPGSTVTLTVDVLGRNLQNRPPSDLAQVKIYLSTNSTWDSGDELLAEEDIPFEYFFQFKEVPVTFTQPDYGCYPAGLFFIARSETVAVNGQKDQDFLFFDSATEDLRFRHTWNLNGGIQCDDNDTPVSTPYITKVGGWLRNDFGCEASDPGAIVGVIIRNLNTNQYDILSPTSSGWNIPSIPAGGRRYFKFSVRVPDNTPEGDYEMCLHVTNATYLNDLNIDDNVACKSFAFYPTDCDGFTSNPGTGTSSSSIFTAGPNPTHDLVTLNYPPLEGSTASFSLADINGRVISTTTVGTKEQTGKFQYDLSNQVNGIYFVRLQFDNGEPPLVKRIVKQ